MDRADTTTWSFGFKKGHDVALTANQEGLAPNKSCDRRPRNLISTSFELATLSDIEQVI
jgi:hypothetical protein